MKTLVWRSPRLIRSGAVLRCRPTAVRDRPRVPGRPGRSAVGPAVRPSESTGRAPSGAGRASQQALRGDLERFTDGRTAQHACGVVAKLAGCDAHAATVGVRRSVDGVL